MTKLPIYFIPQLFQHLQLPTRCRLTLCLAKIFKGSKRSPIAKEFSHHMCALGALEILPLCQGDVDGGYLDEAFNQWSSRLVGVLKGYTKGGKREFLISSRVKSKCISEDKMFVGTEEDNDANINQSEGVFVDLEDIAHKGPWRRSAQKIAISTNGK